LGSLDRGGSLSSLKRTRVSTSNCLTPRLLLVVMAHFALELHRSILGFDGGCCSCAAIMKLTR
jgi:hypothetical protein